MNRNGVSKKHFNFMNQNGVAKKHFNFFLADGKNSIGFFGRTNSSNEPFSIR